MHTPHCPNCRIDMDAGILVDKADYNMPGKQQWAEGAPERSMWSGLKLKGHEQADVVAFRCPQCYLLQSYAPPMIDTDTAR